MANPSKSKGTEAETTVVKYLRSQGYKFARRLTLHGNKDIGDVYMGDGIPVTLEVKGGRTACSGIPSHVKEMLVETANAGNETGAVVSKRVGSTKPEDYIVSMTLPQYTDLLARIWPPPR